MDAWAANFIWIAIFVALLCWWVTKLFWFQKLLLILRVPAVLICTFCAMTIIGAAASLIVHAAGGTANIGQIVVDDPSGAAAYFAETGWETGVFWLPVMLLRTIVLSIKSLRQP